MNKTSADFTETILVVGDLHLFASRSDGHQHWLELPGRIAESRPHRCVLMGDVFDFPWAREMGKERAIHEARSMVAALVSRFPETEFHYLFGNHDHHPEFESLLEKLGDESGNISGHPVSLRLGNTLFMHGDAANRSDMDTETLVRERHQRTENKLHGGLHEFLYGIAVRLRIDEAVTRLPFFPDLVHRRLINFIEREQIDGIEHIVYGHTHRKIHQGQYEGITFTNAGAPIGYRDYAHVVLTV